MEKCRFSKTIVYQEGSPAIHCELKSAEDFPIFLKMKEAFDAIYKSGVILNNEECAFARYENGPINCPFYESGVNHNES